MGVLYDLINKGITDEEINTCYKEMKLLKERIEEVLNKEAQGINISVKDISTYTITVKEANGNLVFTYSKERGRMLPVSGFTPEDGVLFCKAVKGRLFNTIQLLSNLKHRQSSITIKQGEAYNAYVYGNTLTLIEGSKESKCIHFDKLVLKDTVKNYDSIIKL